MAEQIISTYRRLFQVLVLHHYWLDDGADTAALIPAEIDDLLDYDVRDVLRIEPLVTTQARLDGLGGVFKATATGMLVAIPLDNTVPDDAVFEFAITVHDRNFMNYTALTLTPQPIHELYHLPEDRTYRYKENVAVLSNLTGSSRTDGSTQLLFLSSEIPNSTGGEPLEALLRSGNALRQVVSDQTDTHELAGQFDTLPVFVHQADAPAITAPAGLLGTPPDRGLLLNDEMPEDIFALIRIAAVHPTDADFSCTSGGVAKADPPVFQIRFRNRWTYRRYLNQRTGDVVSTETTPLPLTYRGNAGTQQKPSAGGVKLDEITALNNANRLISEIFV